MCKTLERIKEFIDSKGLSISAFERSIGMSNASFSKSLKNKGAIGTDKLENILRIYPELNPEWLLTGVGSMLKADADGGYKDSPRSYSVAADSAHSFDTRPRLPISAAAGALSMLADSVEADSCEYMPVVAAFPSYDFTITIEGDSMEPDYHSGDELACAFVSDPADVKWGKPHILDTTDGVVFKRIFDGGKSIMCNSINKRYGNFEVDKTDVLHIATVVGVLRHTAD